MNWSREFSFREKLLLLILAVLLLFSVYYFFVLRPVNGAISAARLQSESLTTDIEILSVRKERFDAMTEELAAIKAAGDAAAVPDYDNLQQLMGFLNSVFSGGTSYELSIQGVEQPDGGSSVVRRTMDMAFVSASYSAARAAIEQIQRSPYCCQIGALSMAPATGSGPSLLSGAVRTTLTVTFYENAV